MFNELHAAIAAKMKCFGFENTLRAIKMMKDEIQYWSQSLLNFRRTDYCTEFNSG